MEADGGTWRPVFAGGSKESGDTRAARAGAFHQASWQSPTHDQGFREPAVENQSRRPMPDHEEAHGKADHDYTWHESALRYRTIGQEDERDPRCASDQKVRNPILRRQDGGKNRGFSSIKLRSQGGTGDHG